MSLKTTRRELFAAAAALGAAAAPQAAFKTKLLKAQIVGQPQEESLGKLKEGGFDGVETTAADASPAEAEAGRRLAEKVGLRIHSVMRAWMKFNSEKPEEVEATILKTEVSLRAAQAYGADAILLVPCRIDKIRMPQPWEFKIDFDPKTLHLRRVVEGDNAPYEDYIRAHDRSTDMSIRAVERLIPVAEKTGVVIALENVWNNLWVTPDLFAAFVRSFQNRWVRAYFDIGNHVRYAPPEQFLRALGPLVCKLHVKDFKLNPDGKGGNFVPVRRGSINWPSVRRVIEEIGYSGWMTLEADAGPTPADQVRTLETIIAGE